MTNRVPDGVSTDEATLADRVAALVADVEGVARLDAGAVGAASTLLSGRRINGLRITEENSEVHIVLEWGCDVRQVAAHVRESVEKLTNRRVDVYVDDVIDLRTSP